MVTLDMTPLEREQLKVLYTAIYVGLGLIPSTELTQYNHHYALTTRSLARDVYDTADDSPNTSKSRDGFNQRFPTSLGEVVQAFNSQTRGIKQSKLLAKWRWCTRVHNSDILLLRYIRNNVDTVKAARRVGAGLVHHLNKDCNAEQELARGEAFYSDSEGYANFVRSGTAYFSGISNSGAPVVYLCPRYHHPKGLSKQVKRSFSLNLLEHAAIAMPRGSQGCIAIWDMKDWKAKNSDKEWIFAVVEYLRDCYPELMHKIFLVNSPLVFHLFWKLINGWLNPGLREKVVFTKNINDVFEYVSPSELPRQFGGTSTYGPVWSDPRPEDELVDPEARSALEKEQSQLRIEFENATVQWLSRSDSSNIQNKRAVLLDQLEALYWKLDPHTRPRYLWDRHGSLGLSREELVAGNVAQPKCKVNRPVLRDSKSKGTTQTAHDSSSDKLSRKASDNNEEGESTPLSPVLAS